MEDKKCNHKWEKSGIWDGKTPQGNPTGGQIYRCQLCGERAYNLEEIKQKGGEIVEKEESNIQS